MTLLYAKWVQLVAVVCASIAALVGWLKIKQLERKLNSERSAHVESEVGRVRAECAEKARKTKEAALAKVNELMKKRLNEVQNVRNDDGGLSGYLESRTKH